MILDLDHSMSAHAVVEGGTFSFMAPELLDPAKFGLESSIPTREADVFAFGLLVLQVFRLDCLRPSYLSARLRRFSRGNFRSITPQSTSAHMQSSMVCDQENPRMLRPLDSRLLFGNLSRNAGVKKGRDDQGSMLL